MAADTLKEQAKSRELKVGHFIVEFATPGIGHMLKNAGCDFVLFDTEHSGFHNETIKSVIRYFEAGRVPVICRVPSKEYHHIARAADMGAEGIMLPIGDGITDGVVVFRIRRRGDALEATICDVIAPAGRPARSVRSAIGWVLRRSGAEHKRVAIRRLFASYPETAFVLIGDSGQHDPEIYARIVESHPGRVLTQDADDPCSAPSSNG